MISSRTKISSEKAVVVAMWPTQMKGVTPIGTYFDDIQLVLQYNQTSSIQELILLLVLEYIQQVLQEVSYMNFGEFEFSQL